MNLYKALQTINDNLEFKNNEFFDYVLWSCADYGDFLRTQMCKLKNPLQDKEIECKYVVFAVKGKFNPADCSFSGSSPNAAIQIYWAKNGLEVKDFVELNKNLGFNEVYAFRVYE